MFTPAKRYILILKVILLVPVILTGCARGLSLDNPEFSKWKNRKAPNFSTRLIDGSSVELADLTKNRAVLLNFFGSWCPPCRAEVPALDRLYRNNSDKMYLLGLALNIERRNVLRFLRNLNVKFPTALVGSQQIEGRIPEKYGVPTVPTTILIGRDRRIKYYKPGMLRKNHFREIKDLIR